MKFLITLLMLTAACGPNHPGNLGPDQPQDPYEGCDYIEFDTGPSYDILLAPLITTLPVLSEKVICGEFVNELNYPQVVFDFDEYLFPMIKSVDPINFNIEVRTDLSHIPLMDVFYMNETLDDPILVGHFVGSPGVLFVLDWPFYPKDTIKNDLIIQVSGYSTPAEPSSQYEITIW